VDVAIRIGEILSSSLQAITVGKVRRVVCAAPAYLNRRGVPSHPDDLARHSPIQASGVSSSPEWQFNAEGRQLEGPIQPRLTTNTNDSAIGAATAELGVVRLLSYQIARELVEGRLKIVLADHEPDATCLCSPPRGQARESEGPGTPGPSDREFTGGIFIAVSALKSAPGALLAGHKRGSGTARWRMLLMKQSSARLKQALRRTRLACSCRYAFIAIRHALCHSRMRPILYPMPVFVTPGAQRHQRL
jgi:hypothetical protein